MYGAVPAVPAILVKRQCCTEHSIAWNTGAAELSLSVDVRWVSTPGLSDKRQTSPQLISVFPHTVGFGLSLICYACMQHALPACLPVCYQIECVELRIREDCG